jgi:hypothetical protein
VFELLEHFLVVHFTGHAISFVAVFATSVDARVAAVSGLATGSKATHHIFGLLPTLFPDLVSANRVKVKGDCLTLPNDRL